ncbi:MAG: hypothetical protein DRI36_00285 [Caldiserica bacterium]|nr:MAG: hypothetical protein DRI36_00285 [Caldisericota bacterium]
MKGYIEKIERGKALIILKNGGEMFLPIKNLPFKVYEGMHLEIKIEQDKESEKRLKRRISEIKRRLTGKE